MDKYDVTWESAGAVREGRRVFISLRLPDTVIVDAAGINDQIIPFIAALNSHDGSSMLHVVVTPWRPVCANTERFALRGPAQVVIALCPDRSRDHFQLAVVRHEFDHRLFETFGLPASLPASYSPASA